MKRIFGTVCLLMAVAMLTSGCFSAATYKDSQRKIAYRRAVARGDEAAIRAVKLGDNGAGIGVDITRLDTVTEQPWSQFLAALADAGILYGLYEGVVAIEDRLDENNSNPGTQINVTESDDTKVIVINGDQNEVEEDNSTEE